MSDSASGPKVEDVLSSVRRLVSNDIPRVRKPDVPRHGALVLTDAQRIEHGAKTRALSQSLEDRIAELEAAVSKRTDEWEPDGSEDQAQHRPDRIVYTRPPSTDEQSNTRLSTLRLSEIALINSDREDPEDSADDLSDAPLQFRRDHDATTREPAAAPDAPETIAEAPMAEDVPTEPTTSADISAFRRPEDVLEHLDARLNLGNTDKPPSEPKASEGEAAIEPAAEDTDSDVEPVEATDADDRDVASADPDVAEDGSEDGWSDDAPQETDALDDPDFEAALSEAISGSRNDAQTEFEMPVDEEPQDLDVVAAAVTDAALEDMLDEDLLRPLVARLIREELQGELGERITQNVRKLVRREILRALNAHELE